MVSLDLFMLVIVDAFKALLILDSFKLKCLAENHFETLDVLNSSNIEDTRKVF